MGERGDSGVIREAMRDLVGERVEGRSLLPGRRSSGGKDVMGCKTRQSDVRHTAGVVIPGASPSVEVPAYLSHCLKKKMKMMKMMTPGLARFTCVGILA